MAKSYRGPLGTFATHRMDGWIIDYDWREFKGRLSKDESAWLAKFNDYWAGQLSKAKMALMSKDDEDRKQRYRGNNGRKSDALRDLGRVDSLENEQLEASNTDIERVEVTERRHALVWGQTDEETYSDAARCLAGGKSHKKQNGR